MISVFFLLLVACGKKGPPTLSSYEKPQAPSSLTLIHRENNIILQWDYPIAKEGNISDFIVMRSAGAGYLEIGHVPKDIRSYTDADFRTGNEYNYKIIAQSLKGVYSDDSNIVAIAPLAVPPAPAGLTLKTIGDSVVLSWDGSGKGLFNVYKRREKEQYSLTPLNKNPLSEPVYKDPLEINNKVFYSVRSLTGSVIRSEGKSSEEIVLDPAELIPQKPLKLEYFAASDKVYLYWAEPSEVWITGFRIYRKTGDTDYKMIGETSIPTFLDKDAPISRRDYRVHAVGTAKEGPGAEIKGIIFTPER